MSRMTWRGHIFDARTVKMLIEVERLTGITLDIMQGSYSDGGQSAGTHTGGGAFDCDDAGMTAATRDKLIIAMRRVGFAAWWRPTIPGKWGSHFHGIAIGCPDLADSARRQVQEYLVGGDGLVGSNPDPHRGLNAPKQTWEQYVASRRPPFPLPAGHSFGTPATGVVHDGTANVKDADNVRKIQRRLSIKQTGRFGLATKTKVAAWQAWKRLPVSGRVGAETWKRLGL